MKIFLALTILSCIAFASCDYRANRIYRAVNEEQQQQQQQPPNQYQQPLSQHQLLQQQLYAQQLFAQQHQQALFQQTQPQQPQPGFGGAGHTQSSFTSSSSNTNPDGTISFTQQTGSNLNPSSGAANLADRFGSGDFGGQQGAYGHFSHVAGTYNPNTQETIYFSNDNKRY